jgi:predicted nucleic acid-binding protein
MILIDSCMIIPLLRRGIDPAQEFSLLAEQDDICTCGVVRCEVTRNIRAPKTRRALQGYLDCLCYIPTPNKIWERTEDLLCEVGRLGHTIPVTDGLIAACALSVGAAVLTVDKHFSCVSGLQVFKEYPRPGLW